jgi:hypothetical protein
MITVEKKNFGWRINLIDDITPDDIDQMIVSLKEIIEDNRYDYCSIGDFTRIKSMDPKAALKLQTFSKELVNRLIRSVALFPNHESAKANQEQTKNNGLFQVVKSIDVSSTKNLDQVLVDWLLEGIEPVEL